MTEEKNNIKALFDAIKENDLNSVKNLIEKDTELYVNIQNDDGNTPLHLAIKSGSIDIVDYLLNFENIELSLKNDKEETPSNLVYFDDKNQSKDEIIKNIKRNSRFIKAITNRDLKSFEDILKCEDFKFKDREGENEILFFITNIIKNEETSKNTDFIQMIQALFENKNIKLNLTQKYKVKDIHRLNFTKLSSYIYKKENFTPLCRLICDIKLVLYDQDLLEYLIKNYPESESNMGKDSIITDNISDNNNNLFHNICEIYKNKITYGTMANIPTTKILKTLFSKVKNKEEYINAKNANNNTPLDLALLTGNNEAVNFLIRQKEINFEIIKKQNRKVLLYYFIVNGMTDLFKKYFNKEYLKDSFNINNITEKFLNCAQITMNKDIVKTIVDYMMGNIDSINHKDSNDKTSEDIGKLLKVLTTAENPYLDVINNVLNKIDKKCLEQIKNENSEDFQIKKYNDGKETKYSIEKIKNVRKCFAKYSGGKVDDFQGLNQVVIDRVFDYDDRGKILSTVDTAFKIDTNDVVYKKIKTTGIEEENITYYKKDTKESNKENELIEAVIDENRYIKFNNCKVQNSEQEVNDILNSYKNPSGFDNTLSYLEYSQIKPNEKNKNFSVNVSYVGDFNGIVDTFYESLEDKNKEKIYFYNLGSDGHNVQLIICNGKMVLFNTGFEFDYQCTNIQSRIEIDSRYDKLPKDIKNNLDFTEFKIAEQTIENCNLSSKVFAVNFANNNVDKDFSELLENVKQLQKEYGNDKSMNINGADENILDLSNDMLKLSCQIYNENKNNYLVMSKNFARLVKNIEKSILEKYKKIKENKKESQEISKYESLIKKISLLEIKIIKEVKDELKYVNCIYNSLFEETRDFKKLESEKMYIEEAISDLNKKEKTEEIIIKNLKDKGIELEGVEKVENSLMTKLEKLKLEKEKIILERSKNIEKNEELTDGLYVRRNSLEAIINLFLKENKKQFF